jgi:hypothetical protein
VFFLGSAPKGIRSRGEKSHDGPRKRHCVGRACLTHQTKIQTELSGYRERNGPGLERNDGSVTRRRM